MRQRSTRLLRSPTKRLGWYSYREGSHLVMGALSCYNWNMSYALSVVKDKPKGLWLLDGNLGDSSGRSVAATLSGSAVADNPAALVSYCTKSSVFDNTHKAKFPIRVYTQGYERDTFTLEAWVFPIDSNASIMSRTGQADGLAFVNGELKFSLRRVGETHSIAYKPDVNKTMHVVGIYSTTYMALYVNGVLHQKLNFTDAQMNQPFVVPAENFLVVGEGGKVAAQAFAIYEYALSENQIKMHYKIGRTAVDPDNIPAMFGGRDLDISDRRVEIPLREHLGPEMAWTLGSMDTLVVNSDGHLTQQYISGSYKAGTWTYAFDTSYTDTIHGVRLGWEGEGNFVVSTSLDGVTWTVATNNNMVSTITPGVPPSKLFIRIVFAEGDNAKVEDLEISLLKNNVPDIPNRTMTLTGPATPREEWQPLENRNDYGLLLGEGMFRLTPPTEAFFLEDHTLEVWYLANSFTSFDADGISVKYHNGSSYVPLKFGTWNIVHFVSNGTVPLSNMRIQGNSVVIGRIAAYPTALTAAQVSQVYRMYTGKVVNRVNSSGSLTVSTPQVKIYASDWSVISAG